MNQMVQQVKMLLNALNYDEENICIIANQKQKLEKLQSLLDKELGIKSQQIVDDFDFAETGCSQTAAWFCFCGNGLPTAASM